MTAQVKFGEVLWWKDFRFEDKEKADKRFIVLGAKPESDIIGVITTSVRGSNSLVPGWSAERQVYLIPQSAKTVFTLDTWAQLYRPKIITQTEVRQKLNGNTMKVLGALPLQMVQTIRNYLKGIEDISPELLKLLE
jgi:hypothetical protein